VKEVSWSTGYQGCSPNGSPSSTFDPLWETCRSRGEYPLFARRPVVVSGTLEIAGRRLPVVVIANHFKSRLEGESSEVRRLEEASFVGKLAEELAAGGSRAVMVAGDLNDFEGSLPLQALTANGRLYDTWGRVPEPDHYSFIYMGVSQVLDHILVTPDLLPWLEAVAPLHLNADFPYSPYASNSHVIWRCSDHDPVAAMFTLLYRKKVFLPAIEE
jgi:predicted extracellular nuclease